MSVDESVGSSHRLNVSSFVSQSAVASQMDVRSWSRRLSYEMDWICCSTLWKNWSSLARRSSL